MRAKTTPVVSALLAILLIGSLDVGSVAQPPPGGGRGGPRPPGEKPEEKPAATKSSNQLEVSVTEGGVQVYAVNADAHELFTELAEKANLQLIVDDSVKRKITINLVDKQPREVLDYIVRAYGFSFAEVEGILIVSEGIPKNPSSYLLSDIRAVTAKYVQAPQAKSLLPVFLQDHVKMNAGQNAVVLSAPSSVLDKFTEDIEKFDQPAAQITLDVLVVELTDSDLDTFAAQFGWSNAGKDLFTDSLLGTLSFRSITNLAPDFFVSIQALVSEGKARVRANPHISTVSGQPASIFIGQQRYLSTPVTMSGDEYGAKNSIDAGVQLEMTPLTGGEGEIIIEIDEEISTLSAPDPTTGLPNKSTRKARTIVRVNDGQTVIIGGLQQEETRARRTRIPVLSSLPLIGKLFKSKRIEKVTTDLAIFVTPRILTLTGHRPAEEEAELKARFEIEDEAAGGEETVGQE